MRKSEGSITKEPFNSKILFWMSIAVGDCKPTFKTKLTISQGKNDSKQLLISSNGLNPEKSFFSIKRSAEQNL